MPISRTLLGGIAIAGTGLAIGFGSTVGRRRAHSSRRQTAKPEPLAERLDRIEARATQAEGPPAPELPGKFSDDAAAVRASLVSIDERLAAHSREIDYRFKQAAANLQTDIEAIVGPRVEDFRQRLHAEIRESVAGALQTFERSLDNHVWSQITAMEERPAGANLRKLFNAVERRAPEPSPAIEPIFFFKWPFEKQPLKQALAEPAPPVAGTVATVPETDTLSWRTIREAEPSRRPLVTLSLI